MTELSAFHTLADLAAIPTASFHEDSVAHYVGRYLRDLAIPFEVDPYGNILATYRNGESSRPLAFVAHLDHPAIEITDVLSQTAARAALLGGVPAACFDRPVPVLIVSTRGSRAATIVGREVNPANGRVASLQVEHGGDLVAGDWGVFDLVSFSRDGDQISLRAADDLAGVAAALEALRKIRERSLSGIVHAVFTRAEEVGLVGASLVAADRPLSRDTIVISLECSRALPGAEIGSGPVIRVGDRTGAFHPDGEAVLLSARDLLSDTPIQRQLMSGGTCEATAFVRAGYRATGIALPLGNYHNVGPDQTIEPEIISAGDYLGEIDLLVAAAQVAPHSHSPSPYIRSDILDTYRNRLTATAGRFQALAAN